MPATNPPPETLSSVVERDRQQRPSVALRCRCGTETSPIPCRGGCGYICQRILAESDWVPAEDERRAA